jgi:hypothetical protein
MFREPRIAALALAGLTLVAVVVAWRVVGTTYRADVETICEAEPRAGLSLAADMPALSEWLRGHLETPDGNALVARLADVPMADRAPRLREAAATLGIGGCPMVQSYESLMADADYRADLQRLCSYVTFPGLADSDDAARRAAVQDWVESRASNPRTRDLAGPLRAAESPADRARVLRAASRAMGIFTCDVAKVMESPPPDSGADGY